MWGSLGLFLVLSNVQYITASVAANCAAESNVEEYVNILGGTDSRYDISHGSTLPLITRPWGFNGYAPQTDDDPTWPGWWFHPSDRRFFGLRVTHQPSPWIADYGNFLIKAYMPSDPTDKSASRDQFAGFSPSKAVFSPHYFATDLLNYGTSQGTMRMEFAPSQHGGIMKVTFPPYLAQEKGDGEVSGFDQIRRIAIVLHGGADSATITKAADGTAMITGYTKANSGGVGGDAAGFAHFFALAVYAGSDGDQITVADPANTLANSNNAWIDFSPEDASTQVLTVRFATSFISLEQALTNLGEVSGKSFESMVNEAKQEWRTVLSRAEVKAIPAGYSACESADLLGVFYSSLYRASLFPRQLAELTADGQAVHWSPYATSTETRVQEGLLSTDSGFWDAWNTVYPLLSLLNRPVLGATVQGWVKAFQEGEWLPKWASPGYRGSMVGTMGDVSLSSAIVNHIPGFDVAAAYDAIRKDAFVVPPKGVDGVGRVCLEAYLKHGYIPRDASATTGGTCSEVIARGLNYVQSDYAISRAAADLGHTDDQAALQQRASNYSLIFDQQTGFFRSKSLQGKWTLPFDQYAWGGDYTEGGPWQFRFYLPHDPKGLNALYKEGGRDMCGELQAAQTVPSVYHIGGYGSVIHEQTEMADHCYGQYAHNNQPVHHMLYMHMFDGQTGSCSAQGRRWIRNTLLTLYKNSADMFPGDEDNGEMGAWFVLSSLGLYELSPGSGEFVLGVPLFDAVEINISDLPHSAYMAAVQKSQKHLKARAASTEKKILRVEAKNNSKSAVTVLRVLWNGQPLSSATNTISYATLAQGGVLTFEMA